MNKLNQAIYNEFKFNPEEVIQSHRFIISSTDFEFEQYGQRYLFSADAVELEKGLDKGVVSQELKKAFETESFPLSENTTIRKENDNKWVITTEKRTYIIRKEDEKLNICGETDMKEHLNQVGVDPDQFVKVKKVKVLRCTIMSPWAALSRGGNPDYIAEFASILRKTIVAKVYPPSIKTDRENGS